MIDAELLVIDHLRDAPNIRDKDIHVGAVLLQTGNVKSKQLTVEQTAGFERDHVLDCVMIAIQAWASSKKEASDLLREACAAMALFIDHKNVAKCKRTAFYNFPDYEHGYDRYQAIFELVIIDTTN